MAIRKDEKGLRTGRVGERRSLSTGEVSQPEGGLRTGSLRDGAEDREQGLTTGNLREDARAAGQLPEPEPFPKFPDEDNANGPIDANQVQEIAQDVARQVIDTELNVAGSKGVIAEKEGLTISFGLEEAGTAGDPEKEGGGEEGVFPKARTNPSHEVKVRVAAAGNPNEGFYKMQGGIFMAVAGGSWGATMHNGSDSFSVEDDEFPCSAGDRLYASWTTDEEGFPTSDVDITIREEDEMTTYVPGPECIDGVYFMPIAEFEVVDDTLQVRQYHSGTIWFFPDRNEDCTSSSSSDSSSSSSDSSSDSDSGSGSGSGGSDSDGSEGDSEGGSDSSSKNAIVPAPYHQEGYAAWSCVEMGDVRFEYTAEFRVNSRKTVLTLDPRVTVGMEPGTMSIMATADKARAVGATITKDGMITLDTGWWPFGRPAIVTVRVSGIRLGFLNEFLPPRTQEQYEANEQFLKSAYPR